MKKEITGIEKKKILIENQIDAVEGILKDHFEENRKWFEGRLSGLKEAKEILETNDESIHMFL